MDTPSTQYLSAPESENESENTSPQPEPEPESGNEDGNSSWSTPLFDCFSDVKTCCLVSWCPCAAFGRIAEITNKGTSSCCGCGSLYALLCSMGVAASILVAPAAPVVIMSVGCQWILGCKNRGRLKQELKMEMSEREDCCTHFWCHFCALCQEYRELQNRGYHLSLGWEGNMKRQNEVIGMSPMVSPPQNSTMNR